VFFLEATRDRNTHTRHAACGMWHPAWFMTQRNIYMQTNTGFNRKPKAESWHWSHRADGGAYELF